MPARLDTCSEFLSANGPPANTRRAVFIKDRRSIGTPDTQLAQDGHYARTARILKAAGSAPPMVQHRRRPSSRKAPRGRRMTGLEPEKNKAPDKNPAPRRRFRSSIGPRGTYLIILSLGRPRDRCKLQGCSSPARCPQPLPAPHRTLQKPECLLHLSWHKSFLLPAAPALRRLLVNSKPPQRHGSMIRCRICKVNWGKAYPCSYL